MEEKPKSPSLRVNFQQTMKPIGGFYLCVLAALIILALGKGWVYDIYELKGGVRFLFTGIFEPFGQVWLFILITWLLFSMPLGTTRFPFRVAIHSFLGASLVAYYLSPFTVGNAWNLGEYSAVVSYIGDASMILVPLFIVWWLVLLVKNSRN